MVLPDRPGVGVLIEAADGAAVNFMALVKRGIGVMSEVLPVAEQAMVGGGERQVLPGRKGMRVSAGGAESVGAGLRAEVTGGQP